MSNPLLDRRMRLGLTQGEIARQLGVARNYVYLVESGRKPLSDKLRRKLDALPPAAHLCPSAPSADDPQQPPAACRYPEACDLPAELAEVRAKLAAQGKQLADIQTLLLSLLAEARGRHTAELPALKIKAG